MKLIGVIVLAASLSPASTMACSGRYSAKVTCGTIEELGFKKFSKTLVGVKFSDEVVSGGFDFSCKWVEEISGPSTEFTEVAELKKSDAKKLLRKLHEMIGLEVCIFSTSHLDRNYSSVEMKGEKTTEQIMLESLEKFRGEINRQIQ